MGRRDRGLGQAFTADGPTLAAILGALDDIHDLLDERLSRSATAGPEPDGVLLDGEPVTDADPDAGPEPIQITEPAPPRRPAKKTTRKA